MALRRLLEFLVSCTILVCSVIYRTLIWGYVAPPTLFNLLGESRSPGKKTRERISSPLHDLKSSYDVVVIGSGYGGGVAASRMSRAQPKQSVCVLETGNERWPEELGYWHGGFPSSCWQALSELQISGHLFPRCIKPLSFNFGKTTGLYRWICGRESSAFVANGLGGTSLVNANVFLRPDPRVLKSPTWPAELREPGALDKYFKRAEAMLQPDIYPENMPDIKKHTLLRQQAAAVGLEDQFSAAQQTVAFREKTNAAGVTLKASKLTGQDSLGLNDGSKNTVLATYLTDAYNHGAEIYCGCDVRYVRKHGDGGYLIFFRDNASKLPFGIFTDKLRWVHAKKLVFLGAGSLGSTEIILRSREQGLPTSSLVGKGLSGNGGVLSFGYDLDKRIGQLHPQGKPGPTISGTIDCKNDKHWEQSFIVQDGAWPYFMDTMFRITKPILPIIFPSHTSVKGRLKKILRILDPFTDALRYSQVYLALSHDTPCGSLTLQDDLPMLDMRGVEKNTSSGRIKTMLTEMTHAFGGSYIEQGCKVTVHPLGGLGFARDGTGSTGSIHHNGELFTGGGEEVHSGLCAVDGSVISHSLAANPLATITALAERSVELLAAKNGIQIDLMGNKAPLEHRQNSLVTFSEKMEGEVKFGQTCAQLTLFVDVEISQDRHKAVETVIGRLSGTVRCPHLSKDQLMITDGTFRLFEPDLAEACQSTMEYRLTATATNGQKFLMIGKKLLNPSATLSIPKLWQSTTTLFLDVHSEDGYFSGSGLLRLSLKNFVDQMRTMTTSGESIHGRRTLLLRFFKIFTSGLLQTSLAPFAPLQYPTEHCYDLEPTENVQKIEPNVTAELRAVDGVASTLRMWKPVGKHDAGQSVHDILFVPGSAVSHWIYASPYIKQNAIEYFTSRGYRCWCVTSRFGKQHISHNDKPHAWKGYDARLDIAAALARIKRYHVDRSSNHLPPYVIAHCVGSLALASALLDATVDRSAISGITASQIFLHPVLQPLNELKARVPLTRLYRLIAGDWFPLADSEAMASRSFVQSALDTSLRFYPLDSKSEICTSTVCHRCDLAFGRLWNHRNLNKATHDNQNLIFHGTSSTCLEHLASGGRRRTVLDNDYRSLVTEENLERLSGIPIFLFSGEDNQVFKASSTLKTYQLLKARGETVSRKVFAGFGHLDCWMSENSAKVVYASIETEVRKVMFKHRG